MNQEKIEEGLTQFPVCEYAFINIADITFLDKTNIARQISTDRYKGMQLVISKIKKFADSCE